MIIFNGNNWEGEGDISYLSLVSKKKTKNIEKTTRERKISKVDTYL